MKIIDLFAGCGGLSLGFIKNGHVLIKALEFDPIIAESYQKNHPGVKVIIDDIKNVDSNETFQSGECDIIIGGPPCQGFSLAGARIRENKSERFINDPRNYLFKHYFNIVKKIKPKAFVIENVKGIKSMEQGKIFEEIISIFSSKAMLEDEPYNIYYRTVNAKDFGIPQKRERMIIIGVKKNNVDFGTVWNKTKEIILKDYPHYFDVVTVKDAIGNLPAPSENGEVFSSTAITEYQKYLAGKSIYLHNHNKSHHSNIAIKRMNQIKSGSNYLSLNEKINSVHSGAYGRLKWDEQAPTITTRFDTPAGGRFIHPEENRTLTPREAARIQSFPDDFIFYGNKTSICKQIGNAVPPKISFFLSKFLDLVFMEESINE
ncbi:MAG: DNA cytosine methyltransferase [Anaeroplasma bactoclasticum]|nr:DNA cytosine methyltransferase [Anaeroplasma bactoclasticum]